MTDEKNQTATRAELLKGLGADLEAARDKAVRAGMDEHFVSDIKHLQAAVCYHVGCETSDATEGVP